MAIKSGDQILASNFTGMIMLWALSVLPDRWIACDGAVFDMDTYPDLADLIKNTFGQDAGQSITADATTDVITAVAHGLINGSRVVFVNSGGGLPGGISASTIYFIITATADTFQISATSGGAAVNITTAGTGTNTVHNQVKVPDFRGRVPVQKDTAQTEFDVLMEIGGAKTHTLITAEIPSHTHEYPSNVAGGSSPASFVNFGSANIGPVQNGQWSNTGGGGSHNNLQPYIVINFIIHV